MDRDTLRQLAFKWGALVIVVALGILSICLSSSYPGEALESKDATEADEPWIVDDETISSNYTPDECEISTGEDVVTGEYLLNLLEERAGASLGQQPAAEVQAQAAPVNNLSPGSPVPGTDAVFVFTSRGRAHGVGLCMDGVKYRALAGQDYMQIINYYYTGVQIGSNDDSMSIRVKCRDGQVRTYSMKEYLYRLAEEPEDYPAEGLKVLAVAARTYTLSCIARGKHANSGYDICSSGNCCQAFNESKDLSKCPNHIAAVNATEGQIITYNGAPIIAAYCGSCGGHTDNNEDVWGGQALPYLRGKTDTYCSQSPRFSKSVEMSVRDLTGKLNASGNGVGSLQMVDLSDRTPGGRVRNVRLVGSAGVRTVSGRTLANLLGFSSTLYFYTFK